MVLVRCSNENFQVYPNPFRRYASGRFFELLNYALNPANEFVMEELFQAGFESGELLAASALRYVM